jgi:hypothetical protein
MARPRGKTDTTRLNLDISPVMRERLERLKTATDARSMVEVIAWALATYEKLVNEQAAGSEVVIRNGGSEKGLLLTPG